MGATAALPVLAKIAPFVLKGLGQVVGYGTKKKEIDEEGDLYDRLSAEGKEAMTDLEKRTAGFDLADPYKQLLRRAEEDPMGDIARRESQRGFGTTMESLTGAGSKALLGGLGKTTQAFGDRDLGIAAQSFERLKNTLSTTGQAQALVDKAKFAEDRADLNAARQQALKYEMAGMGADQQARRNKRDFLMGLASTAGSMVGQGLFKGAKSAGEGLGSGYNIDFGEAETGRSIYFGEPEEGTYSNAIETPLTPRSADVSGLTPFTPSQGAYGPGSLGQPQAVGTTIPTGESLYDTPYSNQGIMGLIQGLYPGMNPMQLMQLFRGRIFDKGGRTKGAFNHDTNDMKIVDKNGRPTGMSVTGDEVVLTPEQQEETSKESPYFRSLMKTPRFR